MNEKPSTPATIKGRDIIKAGKHRQKAKAVVPHKHVWDYTAGYRVCTDLACGKLERVKNGRWVGLPAHKVAGYRDLVKTAREKHG